AILGAQVALAADQGGGGDAERYRGPIDHLSRPPIEDLSPASLIGGAQAHPTSEPPLRGKLAQVDACLRHHCLCGEHVKTVDLRPVDSRDAVQLRAQIELRSILAAPFPLRFWSDRL